MSPKSLGDQNAQIERLAQQFREHLRKALPAQPRTLDEIEKLAHQIGERVKQEVQKEMLESFGTGYGGSWIVCGCGNPARYVACHWRQLVTRFATYLPFATAAKEMEAI